MENKKINWNEFLKNIKNEELKDIQKVFKYKDKDGESCLFVSGIVLPENDDGKEIETIFISDGLHAFEEDGETPLYMDTIDYKVKSKNWNYISKNIISILIERNKGRR